MRMLDPFEALFNFQRTLDSSRENDWLSPSTSSRGPYPALNVFRKDDDFVLIAELPGLQKADIEIQVKSNAVRVAGKKQLTYKDNGSYHRRERSAGQFDRTVALPVAIDADGVKAEYREGILALWLPRAESDKPKSIKVK